MPLVVSGSAAGLLKRGTIDIFANVVRLKNGSVLLPSVMSVEMRNPLFSHEGPDLYAKAFFHNKPFAVAPPPFGGIGPYQHKLSSQQENQFRRWLKRWHIPFNPNDKIVDYDMRGFWLASKGTAEKPAHGQGAHFPDTFKTPYDTTFSHESMYATKKNPFIWDGNNLVDSRTGQVVFGDVKFKKFYVLVPLTINGRNLSGDAAISRYKSSGASYGWFDTAAHAHSYAAALRNEQIRHFSKRQRVRG